MQSSSARISAASSAVQLGAVEGIRGSECGWSSLRLTRHGGLAEGGRSAQDSILVRNQRFHGLCLIHAETSLELYINWWAGMSLVVHCHFY